jgi:uncharacterized membrane protein YraQ (UPF0718 family)
MTALALGMLLRLVQSILEGAPTLLMGVLLAGVFRHMLHAEGTRRIFGNGTWRCIPQSWALGMLLPVCSLGVIPIAHEMRRAGVSTGAILAFALTAPLFNPLSLLYGLTLSTPMIVIAFATASLLLVTLLGSGWDWLFARERRMPTAQTTLIAPGWQRIAGVFVVACQYLSGSILLYYLIALSGNLLLCVMFPVGSLQNQFGQDDLWAPMIMLALATPVYATPMTVMSQIGSMFVHGNSIGAAYTLLALGTGVNLGLLAWMARNHGLLRTLFLLLVFAASVTGIAYALQRPLRVAGTVDHPHTHAFDIYSAPFEWKADNAPLMFRRKLDETSLSYERVALSILIFMSICGLSARVILRQINLEEWLSRSSLSRASDSWRLDWYLPSSVLGLVVIFGFVAASIGGCYIYYPPPAETLAEMKFVRAEAISAVASRDKLTATRNLERYDELTRRLQVGYYLRNGTLTDFQRTKCRVLRGWLERCKDMTEAGEFESARAMTHPIYLAHARCRKAFHQ